MAKFSNVVESIRAGLERLYYAIPAEQRPARKVIAAAIGAPIGAAIAWAVTELGLPLDTGIVMAAGATVGASLVGWLIPERPYLPTPPQTPIAAPDPVETPQG